MADVTCACPYCGAVTIVPAPRGVGAPLSEVECLPYTRDIGRFDPKDREHWLDVNGWSKIGKDFFTLLGFDRIGILRAYSGMNVWYRVQACPTCEAFFDVYANYSEKTLAEYWPHILEKSDSQSDDIRPYEGMSWVLWLLGRLETLVHSRSLGLALFGILLMALGLFAWLLPGRPSMESGLPPGLVLALLINTIAVLGCLGIVLLIDRYARFESSDAFAGLFNVRHRRSFVYWRNYTRSRIVGVQPAGAKIPLPTQVDIIAGGLAAVSMLLTWLWINFGWPYPVIFITALLVVVSIGYGLHKWMPGFAGRPGFNRTVIILVFLVLAGFALSKWVGLPLSDRWEAVRGATDLAFWLVVSVLLGNGAWLAMNTVLYVLSGLRKVPLRLSPYNGFAQIGPLRRMESYSAWMMTSLFFTLLGVVAVFMVLGQLPGVDSQTGSIWTSFSRSINAQRWLMEWMRWVIAIFFIAVGLGSRARVVWLVVLYLGASIWLSQVPSMNRMIDVAGIRLSGDLLLMGVFLTVLLVYQVMQNENMVADMVKTQRNRALRDIDRQINQVRGEMDLLNSQIPGEEPMRSRLDTFQTLESLFSIREKIEKVNDRRTPKVVEISGVFLWSIFLPTIITKLVDILFQNI